MEINPMASKLKKQFILDMKARALLITFSYFQLNTYIRRGKRRVSVSWKLHNWTLQ
jgi:hypothetical protein